MEAGGITWIYVGINCTDALIEVQLATRRWFLEGVESVRRATNKRDNKGTVRVREETGMGRKARETEQ